MKDIRTIHIQAIELVKKANSHMENGNIEEYLSLVNKAYILEEEAAMELVSEMNAEPTRSIIFRSAANLAYLSGNYKEAEKLIHFALAGNPFDELKIELLDLFDKIKQELNHITIKEEITDNAYFDWLRKEAVYFKVKPKEEKYSKAVAISYIVDFLRNIQNAYKNFSEIHFLRAFQEKELRDFDVVFTSFKRDTTLLAVDVKFKSFGIGVVSDTQVMNYNELYSPKYVDLKKRLFNDFKDDIILPDLNNKEEQSHLVEKYSEDERRKIFSPLYSSLTLRSPYQISISNIGFTQDLRKVKSILPETRLILMPDLIKSDVDLKPKLISKFYQQKGTSTKMIHWEQLKNAVINEYFDEIQYDKKKVVFLEPILILIAFDEGLFTINDEFFGVYVQSNDYNNIIIDFKRCFIEKYSELLMKDDETLNQEEINLLNKFVTGSIRDW